MCLCEGKAGDQEIDCKQRVAQETWSCCGQMWCDCKWTACEKIPSEEKAEINKDSFKIEVEDLPEWHPHSGRLARKKAVGMIKEKLLRDGHVNFAVNAMEDVCEGPPCT